MSADRVLPVAFFLRRPDDVSPPALSPDRRPNLSEAAKGAKRTSDRMDSIAKLPKRGIRDTCARVGKNALRGTGWGLARLEESAIALKWNTLTVLNALWGR
ncbi:hypothetical protein N7533_005831 [Penicillium manginii]|jgi:hypothetical protein|uniref:uncharacterized protein n=1 Tax=Penicillium manginii TaxID=203109 RepID=UPI002547A59B|nr:uncharacterized protein N7533_005831 [Penicillium manginii]KAJ5756288.1 hypothetical protein N7533_005831 [Penicillium manginii]